MPTSPTQLTLRKLRNAGYLAAVVERWNSHVRVRQDLLGFVDVLGIRADRPGVLAVQCTTRANLANRRTKILGLPAAREWLRAGNRIEVWGWWKCGNRWQVTRSPVYLHQLAGV